MFIIIHLSLYKTLVLFYFVNYVNNVMFLKHISITRHIALNYRRNISICWRKMFSYLTSASIALCSPKPLASRVQACTLPTLYSTKFPLTRTSRSVYHLFPWSRISHVSFSAVCSPFSVY